MSQPLPHSSLFVRAASRIHSERRLVSISVLCVLALVAAFFSVPTAHMQKGKPKQELAPPPPAESALPLAEERISPKEKGVAPQKDEAEKVADATPQPAIPGPLVASNYGFTTATNASLTDMSTGTTQLLGANIDDTASALTSIGFDFYFQGARFTQFSINDNGVVRLGATAQTATPYKPLAQAGISIITAYGADQRTHAGDGKVHFKVTGSAPNRVLNIEWLNNQSNFNTGGTADLTYQVRLYETTGVIEAVYGSMTMSTLGAADTNSRDPNIGFSSSNTAGTVGSVAAPQGGAPAPTFDGASATPTANLYTAGVITVLNSAAQGSRRIFAYAPPTPNAPTALNFTGVTQLAMTLNWTDSANETLYAIYRSTDGINFSFDGTAAQNATSYPATGLNPGTNYFWNVYAVSEGALSTALSGSQATGAAGNIQSTGAGGLWSVGATWVGGNVPGPGDNATIVTGATVTIDSSNCLNLTIQTGATLQFEQTTARTLTVGQTATIDAGGVFQSNPAGTQTGHVLSIGGSLVNNGTLDFSTNANTAGAGIVFTGAADAAAAFGGSSTTDFKQTAGVTLNKGTNNTPVLSFAPAGTMTVLGANTVGFLTITNGTFKMDGAGAFSNPLFSIAAYSIPATGGLWMNDANATVVGQNGSPTLTGLFRMTLGTFNIGTASGNSMGFASGANINVEGGAINAAGRFAVAASGNAITYNQTGGIITVCTVGNTSTTLASFDLGTGVGTTNITGGTIIVQLANTAVSGPRDFRNQSGLTGTTTVTGGTVQFGNAASGTAKAFSIAGVFPNLVIDNTSANHSATFLAPAVFNNVTRNITINAGTTFNIGNNVFLMNGTTLTNHGTLTANGASSNFVWFLTTAPQTYQGAGVVTAPITNFAVQADMGLTIDPAVSNITVGAIRLFSGSVINSNKITLGNGGATTGVVQIGNTTTPTACGTFDVPFTFNLGSGGQTISYLRCTASRSTGPEVNPTRSLTTLTYDDNNVAQNLTLAGGNLTVTGTTALTNGRLITGANTQIVGPAGTVTRTTGYVDGNFRKNYTAVASKSFEVGTANGFSPVTVNVTAGTFPGDFTVKAVQGQMPQISGTNALQRYWTLTNAITGANANLTFNYLATDVVGTAASYVFFKNTAGTVTQVAPAAAPTTTQATVNGVTSFSDWTLAEAGALMPGTFAFSSATYTDSETNADHTFNAVVTRTGGSDGNVSVDYQVTDGSATIADNDYTIGSPTGTLTWASGDSTPRNISITVKGDVTVEPDETVNFAILNPMGGAVLGSPNSSVLTITNDDAAGTPAAEGELLISEFRLRGPSGATDEFIEIYNDSGADHTVSALSGTGYGVAASDGTTRCSIPNGTVIPNRGHYLCTNSAAYSLSGYATGNATYTTDIPDNAGIALFNNDTGGGSYSLANRIDAVGSTSEANTLYKEGTGYPALTPFSIDYAFVRDNCGKGGSITTFGPCPSGGLPVDTNNNAADFYFVDTNGTSAGAGQRLGAPGPENLASPIQRNSSVGVVLLDATVAGSVPANRVRDFTSDPANNSTFGTLDIRRRIVNNTGGNVTRLRYRVMDITTFPAPSGIADLRSRTSSLVVVSGINDSATCLASNGVATTPCTVNVQGTTLEQPPSQPNGGGFNSTYSSGTVTLGTPLAPGASINVRFLLGIQQTGNFKFFFNIEALP